MDPRFQNHVLDITVVNCVRLKDTEWFTKQDPYVSFQYGSAKFRTRTCPSGGTSPVFQESFTLSLQGLQEIDVGVWNRHRLSSDNLIGSGKIQLQNVLSVGREDKCWPILTRSGSYAGEVRLILQYSPPTAAYTPPPPSNTAYPPPPGASTTAYRPPPGASTTAYPPQTGPSTTAYPPQTGPSTTAYPPQTGPSNTAYPPQPWPSTTAYPPQPWPTNTPYPPNPPPSAPPHNHHYADPAGQRNRMYPDPTY